MTSLSVIVPARNEEKLLPRTLWSLRHNETKYELIVVCDDCTDRTAEIARRFTPHVHEVIFARTGMTRNHGASHAHGDVLVFCDADTVFPPNYLDVIATLGTPVYGTARWESETDALGSRLLARMVNWANARRRSVCGNMFVDVASFHGVGGFDTRFPRGEDVDLGDRLRDRGTKYFFLDDYAFIPSDRRMRQLGFMGIMRDYARHALLYRRGREHYVARVTRPADTSRRA